MNRIQKAAGIALMLAGHGLLGYQAQTGTMWAVRHAIPAKTIDPSLEGKILAVSGSVNTESEIDDPEYLHPQPLIMLRRVIKEPHEDDDHDVQWRVVDSLGPIHSAQWFAKEALVGGLSFVPAQASYDGGNSLAIDDEMVRRTVSPDITRATWDKELRIFYISLDEYRGFEAKMSKESGTLAVTGLVEFEGIRKGDSITVVGRLEQGNLLPFVDEQGQTQPVIVACGTLTPQEVASRREEWSKALVPGVAAAVIGLLLVFMSIQGVFGWFMFCGVGVFFGALVSEGLGAAWRHLVLLIGVVGTVIATLVIASASDGNRLFLAGWLAVLGAMVALVRSRISKETLQALDDF